MLTLVLTWSLVFSAAAVLLNVLTLVIHLNSWPLYLNVRRSSYRRPEERQTEKTGYFVFLFLLLCNLCLLVRRTNEKKQESNLYHQTFKLLLFLRSSAG